MRQICHIKHLLTRGNLRGRLTRMHRRWTQQPDTTVPMDVVVPVKERPCPRTGIDQTAKTIRIAWAILQRFEGRLGERIVIGYVRPAVGRPEGTR